MCFTLSKPKVIAHLYLYIFKASTPERNASGRVQDSMDLAAARSQGVRLWFITVQCYPAAATRALTTGRTALWDLGMDRLGLGQLNGNSNFRIGVLAG